ncbi:hypothetical protein AVEN_188921-1 [Araneus ventricosus]|uniref:Uncharacterized protein n=1 Tax=Araneus ventricosus TaxID=182803 RepID=A0A4Y2UVS8_ARAVE|nr:hypothetical protein AVEN_171138-1 [Araneus ventricosus]GBO16943.1 hypothetical protein AVEN_188921-1 [Araneus ventricosus]
MGGISFSGSRVSLLGNLHGRRLYPAFAPLEIFHDHTFRDDDAVTENRNVKKGRSASIRAVRGSGICIRPGADMKMLMTVHNQRYRPFTVVSMDARIFIS